MIDQIWSGSSLLYFLLLPFSWLYGLISALRRGAYRLGLLRSWKAPVPVVIVGNLTAGGNGKTPTVIYLVEKLSALGYRVGVVSRGYGGKAKAYPLVLSDKTTTLEAGDEPVLIYQRTGAAVAVAPKRIDAVKALIAQGIADNNPIDIIVTDDGLQHYALRRDLELVVIDGVRRFGNGWWLPAGPMRERESRLASVDAIITNGCVPRVGEMGMKLKATDAVNLVTGERHPVENLNHVVAMAGIGHPPRFFATIEKLGVEAEAEVPFSDHQAFNKKQLVSLTQGEQQLVMTEKDAVKCREFAQENWWYVPVDATFNHEDETLLMAKITALLVNKKMVNKEKKDA